MATVTKETTYSTWVKLIADITDGEQSVVNNTTKVTVVVKIQSTSTTGTWNYDNQTLSVKVGGSSIGSRNFTYNFSGATTTTLGTYSTTVTHNSDGTKSVAIEVKASGGGDSGTITHTLTLPTIARATTPTVSSSSVALGSAVTINLPRASSGFTHKITYNFAGLNGQTSGIANSTNAGTSTTFTPPASLASRIPNSTSNGLVIYVETMNGSTSIGTKSVSISITVPNNSTYNPSLSSLAASEQNSTISSGITGVWVQNHSKIRITATVSLKYSATVKSVRVYIGGAWRAGKASGTTVSITTDYIPTGTGTHNYTMEVTDSRSRVVTSAGSLSVTAYSIPRLTVSAQRNPSNGTQIQVTAKVTGSSLSSKNTLNMEIYIRARGASSWGTVLKNTPTSTNGTLDFGTTTYSGFSESVQYDVQIRAKDELTAWAPAVIAIPTSLKSIDVYKDDGVAIGGLYDPTLGGALQVHNKPAYFLGGIDPIYIPENSNLDDYQKPGTYRCHLNAVAATISNTPVNLAFSLTVEQHAGVKQTFTEYTHQTPRMWVRNYYNGSWGEWRGVYVSVYSRIVYNTMLNGYTGWLAFYKSSNIVYFQGYVQHATAGAVTTAVDICTLDSARFAPFDNAEIRFHGVPWASSLGSNQTPETSGATFRIDPGKLILEKANNKAIRWYLTGMYMAGSTN